MPRNLRCYTCDKPLTGGDDTFGPHGYEMYRACWYKHVDKAAELTYLLIVRRNEIDNGPVRPASFTRKSTPSTSQ